MIKTAFAFRSISRQFTVLILLSGLLLGLLFSIIDGYISYKSQLAKLENQIGQIEHNHIPFLISSLWLTDHAMAMKQVESIASFSYVSCAEVVTDDGTRFTSSACSSTSDEERKFPLIYSYKEEQITIGTLILHINSTQLKLSAIQEQLAQTIEHILLTAVLTILIAGLFKAMVGRPLRSLASAVFSDTPETFPFPLKIDRKKRDDEIEYLLNSINRLRYNLKAHLDEKNMLLREVHHRIKNNIATVDNLLYLQSERISDNEGKKALIEAQSRLKSMLILYDKIYHSNVTGDVHINEYFSPLIDEIVHLFYSGVSVTVVKNIQDMLLPVSMVTELGMLLNELITNSLKHAFPHRNEGIITISICRTDGNKIEFICRDNGIGFDEKAVTNLNHGLGMVLISSIAKSLNASYSVQNDNGTVFRFVLPFKK